MDNLILPYTVLDQNDVAINERKKLMLLLCWIVLVIIIIIVGLNAFNWLPR